jgi:hypothetical protein
MNKNKLIDELTNVLSASLRHKIGSIVNENELYAQKYAKDADFLLKEAGKIASELHWNLDDKAIIKRELERKLRLELEKKEFLNEKKFEFVDKEIEFALRLMGLRE